MVQPLAAFQTFVVFYSFSVSCSPSALLAASHSFLRLLVQRTFESLLVTCSLSQPLATSSSLSQTRATIRIATRHTSCVLSRCFVTFSHTALQHSLTLLCNILSHRFATFSHTALQHSLTLLCNILSHFAAAKRLLVSCSLCKLHETGRLFKYWSSTFYASHQCTRTLNWIRVHLIWDSSTLFEAPPPSLS
jgi:hypothetical protein